MTMHPFIKALVERVTAQPPMSGGTVQQGRDLVTASRGAIGTGPEMASSRDLELPTRDGTVAARLLVPVDKPDGVFIYLHGGGWALGGIDDFDTLGRALAARSRCAVVLVDYRLAPEHPFPAGLHDAIDAIRAVARARREWFGRDLPLAVGGDSAGANLATVAARQLRNEIDLVLQALIYPVADCDFDTPSYRQHATGLPLIKADMAWFFGLYAPAERWADPDISPLRADDLAGSCPAWVVTAEYDVLQSEGQAYADKLWRAGVETEHRMAAGVTHGFIRLHNLFDGARVEVEAIGDRIAAACAGR